MLLSLRRLATAITLAIFSVVAFGCVAWMSFAESAMSAMHSTSQIASTHTAHEHHTSSATTDRLTTTASELPAGECGLCFAAHSDTADLALTPKLAELVKVLLATLIIAFVWHVSAIRVSRASRAPPWAVHHFEFSSRLAAHRAVVILC